MKFKVTKGNVNTDPVVPLCGVELSPKNALILVNEENGEGLWILQHLVKEGVAVVELDGGPHDGFEVLKNMAGEYWYHAEDNFGVQFFIMHNHFKVL